MQCLWMSDPQQGITSSSPATSAAALGLRSREVAADCDTTPPTFDLSLPVVVPPNTEQHSAGHRDRDRSSDCFQRIFFSGRHCLQQEYLISFQIDSRCNPHTHTHTHTLPLHPNSSKLSGGGCTAECSVRTLRECDGDKSCQCFDNFWPVCGCTGTDFCN